MYMNKVFSTFNTFIFYMCASLTHVKMKVLKAVYTARTNFINSQLQYNHWMLINFYKIIEMNSGCKAFMKRN